MEHQREANMPHKLICEPPARPEGGRQRAAIAIWLLRAHLLLPHHTAVPVQLAESGKLLHAGTYDLQLHHLAPAERGTGT